MKTLRLLSLIFLVVLVGFLIGLWLSPHTSHRAVPAVQSSAIQIHSAASGGSTVSIQLISRGTNSAIVAVYVTRADQTSYGGALPSSKTFSPNINGTVVAVNLSGLFQQGVASLSSGDVVKVVCAYGGSAKTTVT